MHEVSVFVTDMFRSHWTDRPLLKQVLNHWSNEWSRERERKSHLMNRWVSDLDNIVLRYAHNECWRLHFRKDRTSNPSNIKLENEGTLIQISQFCNVYLPTCYAVTENVHVWRFKCWVLPMLIKHTESMMKLIVSLFSFFFFFFYCHRLIVVPLMCKNFVCMCVCMVFFIFLKKKVWGITIDITHKQEFMIDLQFKVSEKLLQIQNVTESSNEIQQASLRFIRSFNRYYQWKKLIFVPYIRVRGHLTTIQIIKITPAMYGDRHAQTDVSFQ
ncbi:hypothetical protein RFI_27789 [Reticulomyxa filosa]|uniref:Uncharacterized protein n=1 Tax=Reticulomyxa filosa TaxID=46433 RepID=X6M6G9_RETFI|nr:hypothetical protein RFI_27789 [Reticulomyxa filosa]|eukprot:ETO09588.1 hypothetical protein RFI_27789 [Reticulomyxa filosa]